MENSLFVEFCLVSSSLIISSVTSSSESRHKTTQHNPKMFSWDSQHNKNLRPEEWRNKIKDIATAVKKKQQNKYWRKIRGILSYFLGFGTFLRLAGTSFATSHKKIDGLPVSRLPSVTFLASHRPILQNRGIWLDIVAEISTHDFQKRSIIPFKSVASFWQLSLIQNPCSREPYIK